MAHPQITVVPALIALELMNRHAGFHSFSCVQLADRNRLFL